MPAWWSSFVTVVAFVIIALVYIRIYQVRRRQQDRMYDTSDLQSRFDEIAMKIPHLAKEEVIQRLGEPSDRLTVDDEDRCSWLSPGLRLNLSWRKDGTLSKAFFADDRIGPGFRQLSDVWGPETREAQDTAG